MSLVPLNNVGSMTHFCWNGEICVIPFLKLATAVDVTMPTTTAIPMLAVASGCDSEFF